MNSYDSNKLLKMMVIVFSMGVFIISVMLIYIFTTSSLKNYKDSLKEIHKQYEKQTRLDAKNKIYKLTNFITIYEKELEKNERLKVKNSVELGISAIQDIYSKYKSMPKSFIYEKIRDQFEGMRFFKDQTGYFFIYDLKGKCISLPTTPSLEGTNQINFKDGKNDYTIQKAIKVVKKQNEAFSEWYWYKIGEKGKMQKKIGYVKIFKPLGIFIGAGRYEEDILKNVKHDTKQYLQSLDANQYGHIFVYNDMGKKIVGKGGFKSIENANKRISGKYSIKDLIYSLKLIPEGFFIQYRSLKDKDYTAYIRAIPKLKCIVGTNVKDRKQLYMTQIQILKTNLQKTMNQTILLSVIVLIIMLLLFLSIFLKLQKRFKKIQNIITQKNQELLEQKSIFETIFKESYDGILISKNKKIIDCNNAAIKMFGFSNKKELLDINYKNLMPIYQEDGENSLDKMQHEIQIAREHGYSEFDIKSKKISGEEFWIHYSITKINLKDAPLGHFLLRDVTENKKIEEALKIEHQKLLFQAKHDALTLLPNRIFLMDRLSQNIQQAKRKDKKIAILFLDIDNFKNINDFYGHDEGDNLLKKVAKILEGLIRSTDMIARQGGDEFIIILDDLKNLSDCRITVKKLIKNFQNIIKIEKNLLNITFSMGISIFANDAKDEATLLKYADMAMYKAKEKGKNTYVFYDESMQQQLLEHLKVETELAVAIKNNEFVLHYQPQISIKTGKIIGLEALIRWNHPTRGLVYPDYFIEIAEESDLIISIGNIVTEEAMRQTKEWYDKGYNPGVVSVNFATKQLNSKNISNTFETLLEKTGCKTEWIEIEVLERYIMSDASQSIKILKYFKSLGVRIAIDDFGTGYSSMNYLKLLPITKLKIDKSFIDDILTNKKDVAIAKSIVDLAKGLELEVLAEGVETKEQQDKLLELGCEVIQGYYFSKPIMPEAVEKILQKNE